MSEVIIGTILGGVLTLVGAFLGGIFQHLKWAKEKKLEYFFEKRKRLDTANDALVAYVKAIDEEREDWKAGFDLLYLLGKDFAFLVNNYPDKRSTKDSISLIVDVYELLDEEKKKVDKEIESLVHRWF